MINITCLFYSYYSPALAESATVQKWTDSHSKFINVFEGGETATIVNTGVFHECKTSYCRHHFCNERSLIALRHRKYAPIR